MTGIALAWSDDREVLSQVVTSEVEMREATRQELVDYVALGESLDKAGAYGIQGFGAALIERILNEAADLAERLPAIARS